MLYLNLIPSLNPENAHSLTLHIISYYYLKAGIRITRYASSLFSCSVCVQVTMVQGILFIE